MAERIILIAEDDEDAVTSWVQDVREFNRASAGGVQFVAEYVKNRKDALRMLDRFRIDCAVVDLRMPPNGEEPNSTGDPIGNDILARLLTDVGVPAVVYSGYPQEASDRVKSSQIQVRQKQRGGGLEILNYLASLEPLMSAIDIAKRKIAKECTDLFNGSIWPRWEKFWVENNSDMLSTVITRQMAAHVAERLGLPPNSYHPEEFYVVPALIVDRLNTGDLVKIDDQIYTVVTPRCNMARDTYPDHLMLAWCDPMQKLIPDIAQRLNSASNKTREKAEREVRDFATQSHAPSTHFLPPCGELGPWLVDFRQLRTWPSKDVDALITSRFASIAPQFIPNIVQRFSAYLGRIGQPELDRAELQTRILAAADRPQ